MEFFGFLVILKESIKLVQKNGKLFTLLLIISVALNSILFLASGFSVNHLTYDFIVDSMNSFMPDPSSFLPDQSSSAPDATSFTPDPTPVLGQLRRLRKDLALLLAVQMAFSIAVFLVSILSTTSFVLVSAESYKEKKLTFKDLWLGTVTTWKRALVTGFYAKLIEMGYLFLVVALAAPLFLFFNLTTISILVTILLFIPAFIYYVYLTVVWILAIVVSVADDIYGMEALGKAATLIKGKRLQGFMLNICFSLIGLIVFQGFRMIMGDRLLFSSSIYMEFMAVLASLTIFFSSVVYVVLYFQCKKQHGEETELYGSVGYSKLPTTQPVDE